ncbi:hypothetical protein GYMLUDRAFT_155394 [Collybiopsis luxurians FD-317 M1]|nr:hypothetical protein GYMLUDRAFT_155394 [Collybiopsis luxurians FD-317 M1]
MKRLVSYSSSDDESQPQPKKKKLPSLSSSLQVPTPKDNPALHQGRLRTTPHVDGQWASHVYIPIRVEIHSGIYKVVMDALQAAKRLEPALHDFFGPEAGKYFELHVSLSRPIYLRAHQRDDLKRFVRLLAEKCSSFKISFTTFSVLTNDEQTRTFLALDVGSGHRELKRLSDDLSPFLSNLRQKTYYTEPKFHASIAWALLHQTETNDSLQQSQTSALFQTVTCLPDMLTALLNKQYAPAMSKSCCASDVQFLCARIGQDVFSWRCQGREG